MCCWVRNFLGLNNRISGFAWLCLCDLSLKYCFFFFHGKHAFVFLSGQCNVVYSFLAHLMRLLLLLWFTSALHILLWKGNVFSNVWRGMTHLQCILSYFFPSQNVCKCDKIAMSHKEHPNKGKAKKNSQHKMLRWKTSRLIFGFPYCRVCDRHWLFVLFLKFFYLSLFPLVCIDTLFRRSVCVRMFFSAMLNAHSSY